MPTEPIGPAVVRLPIPVRRKVADALACDLANVAEGVDYLSDPYPFEDGAPWLVDDLLAAIADDARLVAARAWAIRIAAQAALGGPVDAIAVDALEVAVKLERAREVDCPDSASPQGEAETARMVAAYDRALAAIAEARR